MKLIKTLLKGVIGLVLLVVIVLLLAVGAALFYIDTLAKTAVETGGTVALGVPTRVDNIDLSIFSGKCQINGLRVSNPVGYQAENFLRLDLGRVEVQPGSLRQDTIVIPEILLQGVQVSIEKTRDGANYDQILQNLQKLSQTREQDKQPAPAEPQASQPGRKMLIQRLTVREVAVQVRIAGLLKPVETTIKLPKDIELTDIGSAEDAGAQMKDVVAVIVQSLLTAIVEQGGGLIPGEIGQELTKGLEGVKAISDLGVKTIGGVGGNLTGAVEDVTKDVGKLGQDTGKVVGEAVGGAAEKVGDVGKKAAEETGKVLEGLGGLLGGAKNETKEEPKTPSE